MDKDLTAEQKHILFEEGTEPPGSSSLNYEKREGDYFCAGCGTKLFESKTKYFFARLLNFYSLLFFLDDKIIPVIINNAPIK